MKTRFKIKSGIGVPELDGLRGFVVLQSETPLWSLSYAHLPIERQMMSKQQRRHLSAAEKVKILRLHLLEGKAISALCEEYGIQPSLFYN